MMETIGPIKEAAYEMPTRVIFGRGALAEIGDLPEVREGKRLVLVVGGHFKTGKDSSRLKSALVKNGRKVAVYGRRILKSNFATINELANFCRRERPEAIIAVGGGTILDSAKCAAILAKNDRRVEEYVREKTKVLKNKRVTFIAVPTTAGTGSEVTPWATVWDEEKKRKYSLASPLMFPDLAIVDPSLTDELPPKVTAESGIDALTQAIEAYWSVKHNPVSDEFALKAIKSAMETLEKVVNDPDQESRDKMAKASLLAGLAFSNTQTTICHSVSYPMTAHFGVAHGQAVAITLPLFIEYSLPVLKPKRKRTLLSAIGGRNEKEAATKITVLMRNCGLATRLSEVGIGEKDIDLIVSEGFHPNRAQNAPRIPTPKELKRMLYLLL